MNPRARQLIKLIARAIVDDFNAGRDSASAPTPQPQTKRAPRSQPANKPAGRAHVDTHQA